MDSTSHGSLMALGLAGLALLLLTLALIGLAIGALARFLLPGPDPMSLPSTAGFGIAGSIVGGLVGRLINLGIVPGYVLSVGGAMLLIWFFRRRGAKPVG
jgi:uncharacterized membrane protein YeaQ/YmgE (transglycosylase-associated protein family)